MLKFITGLFNRIQQKRYFVNDYFDNVEQYILSQRPCNQYDIEILIRKYERNNIKSWKY
jgi:hypothetical protein